MIQLENQLRKELIGAYESYLVFEDEDFVINKIKKTYDKFIPSKDFVSEELMQFVVTLFPIAYPKAKSGREKPTKEEIKEILKELKSSEKKNS